VSNRTHPIQDGWRLTRWLQIYLAMLLTDAAVVVAVVVRV